MNSPVYLSDRAGRDIRQSYIWLVVERDRDFAEKWHRRVHKAIAELATDARQWPEAAEARWYGPTLREKPVGRKRQTCRILFEIVDGSVWIHRIRHASFDFLTPDDF
jgi:hypothetical protein